MLTLSMTGPYEVPGTDAAMVKTLLAAVATKLKFTAW